MSSYPFGILKPCRALWQTVGFGGLDEEHIIDPRHASEVRRGEGSLGRGVGSLGKGVDGGGLGAWMWGRGGVLGDGGEEYAKEGDDEGEGQEDRQENTIETCESERV